MLLRFVRDLFGSPARADAGDTPRAPGRAALERGLQLAAQREASGDTAGALGLLDRLISDGQADARLFARTAALCAQTGDLARARGLLEAALKLDPTFLDALVDLATVLKLEGRLDAALEGYTQALAHDPNNLGALSNLGQCRAEAGDFAGALVAFTRALRVQPRWEPALRGLAALARTAGLEREVGDALRILADADSANGLAQAMYGYHLLKRDLDASAALQYFERALAAGWSDAETLGNRAIALQDLGRLPESFRSYDAALERDPRNRLILWHRSLAQLLDHQFGRGWDDYELRLQSQDWPRPALPHPIWDGSPIPGKTVLLLAEQGLGDEIMFAGCFRDAVERCGRCVIDCNPKLAGLFARSFPQAEIHPGDQRGPQDWVKAFEPIDYQVHAGSLPRLFRRSTGAFPNEGGFLRADPARTRAWRERLEDGGSARYVGLSWRGGTVLSRSRLRSLSLEQLLPLLSVPGIRWVSLQYDAQSEELEQFAARRGIAITHWREAIADYDETAALLSALDLTLSVCTAVVHLGGALGRPLWVMAPHSPEWRYGIRGERMPWYPSVRVFRQPSGGAWAPLLSQATQRLAEWTGAASVEAHRA